MARPESGTRGLPGGERRRRNYTLEQRARRPNGSRSHASQSVIEDGLRVVQLFPTRGDIQNERFEAAAYVPRHLIGNFLVAAHEIGAEGLIILKRPHPVDALYFTNFR